jgi:DNA-directed RNA polymerase specialized sigma24 family protein
VIRCVHCYGMTLEQTATSCERPVSTISYQLASGRAKLRALVAAAGWETAPGADGALEKK